MSAPARPRPRPRPALAAAATTALAAAIACASGAGCDQLFDIQELATIPGDAGDASSSGADAASDGSAGADGGADANADTGGAGADSGADTSGDGPVLGDAAGTDADASTVGCPGPTLYVAPSGDDSNPGCDPKAPKKTVTGAVTAAAVSGSGVTAIEVCAGTYVAPTLSVPVSLRGGYDCNSWQRTATYGYPTFDGTHLTTLQSGGTPAALTITGQTIGSSTVVDGFTIQGLQSGASPLATTAAAVLVTGSAAPTLSNDVLVGGSGGYAGSGSSNDPTPASAGVFVTGFAAPTLQSDSIQGGSGTSSAAAGVGSAGVYGDGTNGNVTITSCAVEGGSGSTAGQSGSGSTGVYFSTGNPTQKYTIQSSTVLGGTGSNPSCAGNCRATRGVYVASALLVAVESSAVDGGDVARNANGAVTGDLCPRGVEVVGATGVSVTGSRIYGGRCNIPSPSALAVIYGLYVSNASSLLVANDMIHMGVSTVAHDSAAVGVSSVTNPIIVHDTLIAGPTTAQTAAALWIESGTTGATIQNDILAATGADAAGVGLMIACASDGAPAAIQTVRDDLVFATTGPLLKWSVCNTVGYTTMQAANAALLASWPGATVTGNVTMASSCTGDGDCITVAACSSQSSCLTALLAGFDTASFGYANLFPAQPLFAGACPAAASPPSGNGWPLATDPPCAVAHSFGDSSTYATDLYGNCRSTTAPSMGAAEYLGTTCQ